METQAKANEVLNDLISIHNDRIEGYEHAQKETKHVDLKALFERHAMTSKQFRSELAKHVHINNGEAEDSVSLPGQIYHVWMDAKAALSGNDRKAVLSSCEYGEDVAVKAYQRALEDSSELTSEQSHIIERQHLVIKEQHDKIRSMRDGEKD